MSEPFVGEIRLVGFNFAPVGWAFCDGQLLAVTQNEALFSLYGTLYGGDGRTTFGLPDLRGRLPIHYGSGAGLPSYNLGTKSGVEKATVSPAQVPSHSHSVQATSDTATAKDPTNLVPAAAGGNVYKTGAAADAVATNAASAGNTGGNQDHNNVMPFMAVHFIVALFGVYPSRT